MRSVKVIGDFAGVVSTVVGDKIVKGRRSETARLKGDLPRMDNPVWVLAYVAV